MKRRINVVSKLYPYLFVFSIEKGLVRENGNEYEAIRKFWYKIDKWQYCSDMYAIGLVQGNAICAFKIDEWKLIENKNVEARYEFSGKEINDSELLHKNWKKIIELAKGYWGFGGWLVVSLNENNQFRILRGSHDNEWHEF